MFTDTCVDMCVHMSADTCVDMCVDMCVGVPCLLVGPANGGLAFEVGRRVGVAGGKVVLPA